jgi:hypothetical protein
VEFSSAAHVLLIASVIMAATYEISDTVSP